MPANIASIRSAAANLGLVLVSCVAGLALCEVSLRLFYPKYRHLAEAQFSTDAMRIWARTPNSRDWINHPDTGMMHSFHHNNLALRQHRDFIAADLAAAINIGVFGDSFTENTGMPAQYSFTEPLDYLLNQSGGRFNVLNFGVHGYGTGQSLLHYEYFRYAEDLDYVFYVYCENDLNNIYRTGLFYLDAAGHLVRNEGIRESWYAPLLRRLHTAYLVLAVRETWSSGIAETATSAELLRRRKFERVLAIRDALHRGNPDQDRPHGQQNSVAIFRQLIRRWKHLAESNGSTFSVVFLPTGSPHPVIVALLKAEDVESIDLNACFGNHDPAHHERAWHSSPYRFRNDGHWNEAGNQLAALCLYRFLEENVGLPRLSEEQLWEAVSRYYAAFAGGMPLKPGGGRRAEGVVSLEAAAEIREKYLALDIRTPSKEKLIKWVTRPHRRIITSDFDVYLYRNDIFYVKEDCRRANLEAPFFLHMIPVDERALRVHRRSRGFERLLFDFAKRGFRIGRHGCATKTPLRFPIRYIRTGQYVPDEGRLWEGEGWIDPPSVEEEKPKFPVAAGPRIIRSDFDVYLDGRQLVYHKADCGPADRAAPFFLQVTPVDATVLPRDRRQAGFDSLAMNSCTIERRLPAYAIRHIRTGQYAPDESPLWAGEFTFDQVIASGGRAESATAPQRIIRSVFDVTLDGRRLIYSKTACRAADWQARFFLHVTPVDVADLPISREGHGFDNLDFSSPSMFTVNEFGCTRKEMLPAYAIRSIRTGQYIPGKGRLWEGEFAMEEATGVAALRAGN